MNKPRLEWNNFYPNQNSIICAGYEICIRMDGNKKKKFYICEASELGWLKINKSYYESVEEAKLAAEKWLTKQLKDAAKQLGFDLIKKDI
jgi:hypothetical protein